MQSVIIYNIVVLDVYDYFRAVMWSGEKSRRVLALTADAISLNAANYTVWQYRLAQSSRIFISGIFKDAYIEL